MTTALATAPAPPASGTPGRARVERDIAREQARLQPPGRWVEQAACRSADPDAFYATHDDDSFARSVCAGCPVVDRCLAWALETAEPHGVWGGLDERERKALLQPTPDAAAMLQQALERARAQAAEASRRPVLIETAEADPAAPAGRERTVPGMISRAAAAQATAGNPRPPLLRRAPGGKHFQVRVTPCPPPPGERDRRRALSDREIEVLAAIADGKQREHAAGELGISPYTVKSHRDHVITALGANSDSAHAVSLGYAHGYLTPEPGQHPDLGERALDVLVQLTRGLPNKQIAKELFVSEFTVKTHLRRLMKSFGVNTRCALVSAAFRCGLFVAVLDESGAMP